jgi:transcriptional regulator with XRE-family HTH domain
VADQDVRTVFAASVRRERKARGWTLDEMAARSGVTHSTIVNVETRRTGTTLDVAALLAEALGTTIGALADGQGDGRG